MATLYRILLSASGLSQREAADFHGVRLDTVKNWCHGRSAPPDGAVAELKALVRKQLRAGAEWARMINAAPADVDLVELGLASDDYEAQQPPLGWPCVSAQAQAIGFAAAQTDRPVKIVPRGSTVASAGAADVHERK